MSVKIITDSACDITQERARELRWNNGVKQKIFRVYFRAIIRIG